MKHPGLMSIIDTRHWPGWLVTCLFVGVLLSGCTMPQLGDSEAALALEDLASGLGGSRLAAQTPAPERDTVSYSTAVGERRADLYLSPEGARAGIVLVPGVVAEGGRDPRLVAVARTLARLRFAVLVPDMPEVRRYRLRATDADEVAAAFAWLANRPELAPQGAAGIAGFSYGAGPVLLAAMQPDIREQVRFVLSVGGYYSLQNVIAYLTTGYPATTLSPMAETIADTRPGPPHPYGIAVFIRSNLDLLERSVDRGFLRSYADYLIDEGVAEEEPLVGTLAPDASAFYELLNNHDPRRVPALIERLPERIRVQLRGIDPSARDLAHLRAQVILLHGRGDNLVPYTESITLANALPEGQAQLFLIDGLAHVDLMPAAHDIPQLLAALETLLAERIDHTP
jgi:fermentation-respiration switch protein FrsA (DUF1100 family)